LAGLDPHQDTPVEILHVVLLGFVKYFWRDLVKNRLSTDKDKNLLITRLNDCDVSGLGIPTLAGKTLVQHAGSLTGRDFRAISQVAPFVIRGLVSDDIYEAWVSLSTLVPLIWQPVITNVTNYMASLRAEIHNFLLKTARWSTSWFNKAKFHIITHLPGHVYRFGPAILFATEAFESFNAVIRGKSTHSNRQAPSRDIALAFAQGNRVRHLFSGGYFAPSKDSTTVTPAPAAPSSRAALEALEHHNWKTIGPAACSIIAQDPTALSYLGLKDSAQKQAGRCEHDSAPARPFSSTLTGQRFPDIYTATSRTSSPLFVTSKRLYLSNGDACSIGQYAIVRHQTPASEANTVPTLFIGCVREIIQRQGSENHSAGLPDGILVQTAERIITADFDHLPMPKLKLGENWSFVRLTDLLCTVNTQHNCFKYDCRPTGFRHVYQERVQTSNTVPTIIHTGDKDDIILNTAQMRDAVYLQHFRIPTIPLNETTVIEESIARTI
ncbi:hypothetical protein CPC08DRAFT_595059, partial [Agrocybe pediades]